MGWRKSLAQALVSDEHSWNFCVFFSLICVFVRSFVLWPRMSEPFTIGSVSFFYSFILS